MERHSSDMVPEAAPEKRKGVPWSEEEHRLFLLGLAKFGKGDWRSISRHFVLTRTPTQVRMDRSTAL
jgi:SHAQKYF class myb-like DNA-binding protein